MRGASVYQLRSAGQVRDWGDRRCTPDLPCLGAQALATSLRASPRDRRWWWSPVEAPSTTPVGHRGRAANRASSIGPHIAPQTRDLQPALVGLAGRRVHIRCG